ncbi:MAG: hypothetical protein IKP09_06130 [Lentisphaeria bacterium]|nr:hypothetical protein [Lentisphaeria bacterium]
MADDYENYIFEHKREITNDFVLANGDVTTVLKGLKPGRSITVTRTPSAWNTAAPVRSLRTGYAGFPVVFARNGKADGLSFSIQNHFSMASGSRPGTGASVLSGVQSVLSAGNASNGESLTLKEQATPVFSGLFADHNDDFGTGLESGPASDKAAALPSFDSAPEKKTAASLVSATDEPSIASAGKEFAAGPASRNGVKRSLTLNAEDMANCKSYQIGYEDPDSSYPAVNGGTAGHSSVTVEYSGKEHYVSTPGTGYRPISGEVVIDDPHFGWIGIPERPIGGWIGIPERPIGGWIPEHPIEIIDWPGVQFEEYSIFDAYGVDLSCDWTEYQESDFSKIDLAYGAKLSFTVRATNAASFTIYRCVEAEDGSCELTAVQTTALAFDKESGNYVATTQALLLEAGQYCLCVQSSAGAPQDGDAPSYQFELNKDAGDLFVDGDNSDDWTDLATAGADGEVQYIGTLDEYSYGVLSDWVGFGDAVDYAGFTLDTAAKLSFTLDSTDAAKFTLYKLVQDKNGKYSLKSIQTTTLAYDKEFEDYEATTKALLLEAGDYYISMQSPNAAQGGSASYDIYLNDEEVCFFTEGDDYNDWTDMKTAGADGEVGYAGYLDENSLDICSGWVGFGDASDYMGFTLGGAANLSFSIDSTDAVKFTVYQLIREKNGTYSLKTLQTTTLKYDAEFEQYYADTKALLLEAGEYYFSVQSANAAQGGSADYNVYLNYETSEFFTEGNNCDDWTDLATEGASGEVGWIGTINESSFDIVSDWVGFGDAVDYMGFTLDTAAKLSFSLDSTGAAKFTIYQLLQDKNGTYSLKALQTTTLSYDKEYEEYEATTKSLYLAAGDYYIAMQSTNADQGGSAWYSVYLNIEDSMFFTGDDGSDSWADLETLGPDGSVGDVGAVDEYSGDLTSGWVGANDSNFARFTLFNAAQLSFSIDADAAGKFTVYRLVQDKNGKYSLDVLQSASLTVNKETGDYDVTTKALLLEAGDYYFSMQTASASQDEGVSYSICLNGEDSVFYTEANNYDDWTDLKTLGPDGWVGYAGMIDEYAGELISDWVGFGDAVDYNGFFLGTAASVSFSVNATDAASFTVWQLVQGKNGTYSLKALQTTSLALNRASGEYEATTKALLLEAGDYYFSVQSANAAQGGSAYYTVNVNQDACAFYAECDNSDDWTDLATAGAYGEVGWIGAVDEYTNELVTDGWVGFGDAADYMGFTLFYDAKVSFSLDATDAVSFTIYELIQDKNGTYSLKALQTTSLSLNRQTGEYEAATKGLLLRAGDYFVSVQSATAAQGGGARYNMYFNGDAAQFYPEADTSDDWTDMKTEGACGLVGFAGVVDEYTEEIVTDGWVGFGDEIDYAGFTLFDDAKLSFALEAEDAATFTVYSLVEAKNGTFSLKTLQSTALVRDKVSGKYTVNTKALSLEAGDYFFSMRSDTASQGGSAHYNVALNGAECEFFPVEDYDDWGEIAYEPAYEPIYRIDPVKPVERTWVCGYPPCDEPVAAEPVGNDVLACADGFAADAAAGLAVSDVTDDKPLDAQKELFSIA